MLRIIRPHVDFLESYAEAVQEDFEMRPEAEKFSGILMISLRNHITMRMGSI